jgi:hypothetical protein
MNMGQTWPTGRLLQESEKVSAVAPVPALASLGQRPHGSYADLLLTES